MMYLMASHFAKIVTANFMARISLIGAQRLALTVVKKPPGVAIIVFVGLAL